MEGTVFQGELEKPDRGMVLPQEYVFLPLSEWGKD